jgi:molybdate transport system ATP-binding protein
MSGVPGTGKSDMRIGYTLTKSNFRLSVDVTIPDVGITVLFGPSGCGKTTLLRCIAGLEPTSSGTLSVGTETWQSSQNNLPSCKRPIGFVFQDAGLFSHLSVKDNLYYGWKRISPVFRQDLSPIVDLLGIGDLLTRKPHHLSGGQMQRVAIARALAVSPRLLLLDEPLSSLDDARKREILPYIEKLRDTIRIPILYVTHSMNEVARLADYIVVLKNGEVCTQGLFSDVLTNVTSARSLGDEAGTVLSAIVAKIDMAWDLARMDFEGGSIWIRDCHFSQGESLRIRILARDVSLAVACPSPTSIQNILEGIVDSIGNDEHHSLALVRIKIGTSFLLARLTRRAMHLLGISVGTKVWAQIKSAAFIE